MSGNPLKIRQVHHLEFYVGNAKQADYFYRNAFGFSRIGYSGLETGDREKSSYALQQGTVRLVLTTPHHPDSPISEHIRRHGDGVRDIALEVEDADLAYEESLARGAVGETEPHTIEDEFGEIRRSSVRVCGSRWRPRRCSQTISSAGRGSARTSG